MHCCCNDGRAPAVASAIVPSVPHRSAFRRAGAALVWAVPVAVLAGVPKCPACVAAYVLLFTGLGLSFASAAAVRWTLVAVSVAALGVLALRAARRAVRRVARRQHFLANT
ncbi:MAG TPA: hypothetical protein VD971_13120 [Phycisphaerales bacterium]|nr:hypothetical protein [Phycisphaerales bacterium]